MRLATRANGRPDGELVAVSSDAKRCIDSGPNLPNLLSALENWGSADSQFEALAARLDQGEGDVFDAARLLAPMPRSWQWLDGSAFQTHADLMQVAFDTKPLRHERPLMYQGMSDRFLGSREEVAFSSEKGGIDFEGEYGVIVDAVPMGTGPEEAMKHIRLIVQINDWSLRAYAMPEMLTGFGFILAKPACSVAPFAVTPDELGEGWQDGRVCLDLHISWNGKPFGHANGREMAVGFHELVAHAATTRDLVAGTIIGSGTVANRTYAEVGSSCITERRAIEIIAGGKPETGFMRFGDTIRMEARMPDGTTPFGAIEQRVIERVGNLIHR